MRSVRVGVTIALSVVMLAGTVYAQERPADNALARYNAERKSEFGAAALEWVLPVLGHAYAGDASRGLKPLAVSGGGLVLIVVGLSMCQDEFLGTCVERGNAAVTLLGLGGWIGGRIWGIVSALDLAQEHNEALRRRLNLTLQPAPGGVGLGLSYIVRF